MNMWQKRIMALFVGLTMVISIVGFAFMHNPPRQNNQGFQMPNIVNRTLTPEEKVYVLRSGKTLIEYVYPINCTSCLNKVSVYHNFANSPDFKNYVVLECVGIPEINETIDKVVGIGGDATDLSHVNSSDELEGIFCDVAIAKPDICILREI